jgi:hypothetical protein
MQNVIRIYLMVTGSLGLVAMLVPGLVVIGYYLLIVPGLILAYSPTAFLWGSVFAGLWWLGRSVMGEAPAALAALAATAALLYAVPQPSIGRAEKQFREAVKPDVLPDQPIELVGDVLLTTRAPRWDNDNGPVIGSQRAYACDHLCVAMLFSPTVRSVTVNSAHRFTPEQHRDGTGPLEPVARTYRMLPKAQCGTNGIKPDLASRIGLFGGSLDEDRALDAEWRRRLDTEVCIVRELPPERFDTLITHGDTGPVPSKEAKRLSWSLGPRPTRTEYAEIRDATGAVLMHKSIVTVPSVAAPFRIEAHDNGNSPRFGWGTRTRTNGRRYEQVDLLKLLETHTTLGR